jgi:hypothetical protein
MIFKWESQSGHNFSQPLHSSLAVETMHPVYQAQLITYLKLSDRKFGYLINFNVPLLKDGFKRIVYSF